MAIGWFIDLPDAEVYFEDERLETECWDNLQQSSSSGSGSQFQKSKVLVQAYNRIFYDTRWMTPTFADASAAELEVLRKVNGEMAYYLACHLSDEDRRKGIQSQGVVKAGVVKEDYDVNRLDASPVPGPVMAMLAPWLVLGVEFGIVDIKRDENEPANSKVHDYYDY